MCIFCEPNSLLLYIQSESSAANVWLNIYSLFSSRETDKYVIIKLARGHYKIYQFSIINLRSFILLELVIKIGLQTSVTLCGEQS